MMTGDDVKAIREALDMTQTEFAEAFGISRGHLRNMEQGQRPISHGRGLLLLAIQKNPGFMLEVATEYRTLYGGPKIYMPGDPT